MVSCAGRARRGVTWQPGCTAAIAFGLQDTAENPYSEIGGKENALPIPARGSIRKPLVRPGECERVGRQRWSEPASAYAIADVGQPSIETDLGYTMPQDTLTFDRHWGDVPC